MEIPCKFSTSPPFYISVMLQYALSPSLVGYGSFLSIILMNAAVVERQMEHPTNKCGTFRISVNLLNFLHIHSPRDCSSSVRLHVTCLSMARDNITHVGVGTQ